MNPETHAWRCYLDSHSLNEYMAEVTKNIAEYGQHLAGVLGDPGFTYTVGLLPAVGYELIMCGPPPPIAAIVLNDIGAALRKGLTLEFDKPYSLFTNLPVKFLMCGPKAQEVNGIARRHFRVEVPMAQIVLCDRAGKFPGEAGFDHAYMDPRQPLLQ